MLVFILHAHFFAPTVQADLQKHYESKTSKWVAHLLYEIILFTSGHT